ncbi:MAG: FAD-binding oxidoreductase [Chitinophagaceae bacterium]|nr:FAD-binding oxidoreductase [Chitinophagaceae bacterium]
MAVILVVLIGRPAVFLAYHYYKDNKQIKNEKPGYTNDASNLNETRVFKIIQAFEDTGKAISQISELVLQAKSAGKKISISGARHSMGGHTIYPDGILLDMKSFHYMQLDTATNILSAGSGALWDEIIPYLNSYGKSISVMQSNNSFSVGGSVSVNCHGWQPNAPPIASTVESFRMIDPDGKLIQCSRYENEQIFSLALGGYGLFGVILDVKLKVVDNKMYTIHQYLIKSKEYIQHFDQFTKGKNNIGLVYGRININPDNFMEEAIISVFTDEEDAPLLPLDKNKLESFRRTVFRASAKSEYGKNLRWQLEKLGIRLIKDRLFSRNQLLNEGVEIFQNTDTTSTDILHEYFIPKDSVASFIGILQSTVPGYDVDLLNITVRNVKKDEDTYLRYANEEVFGFVMLFNQTKNDHSEEQMRLLTQRLIDASIALKGTYYLPYRLHATKEQMQKAYPQAKDFFLLKKKYDPSEVFSNQFYEAYR